jgi:hypothetical protein
VDNGDWTIWRDTLGSTMNLSADGDDDGIVDQDDYNVWIAHFGYTFSLTSVTVT